MGESVGEATGAVTVISVGDAGICVTVAVSVGVKVGVGVGVAVFVGVGVSVGVFVGRNVGVTCTRTCVATILEGVTWLVGVDCSAIRSFSTDPPKTVPMTSSANMASSSRPAQLMPSTVRAPLGARFSSFDLAIWAENIVLESPSQDERELLSGWHSAFIS